QVQLRDIVDVHVRPAVESTANVGRDPAGACVPQERRDLVALGRRLAGQDVGRGGGGDGRADVGGGRREHAPVDRDTGRFSRDGVLRYVRVDRITRLTAGFVGNDARPTRVNLRLAGAGERLDQGLDGLAIVGVSGVDDRIRR